MTVNEAIKALRLLQTSGLGNRQIRIHSELHPECSGFPEATFELHAEKDNPGNYDMSFGDWIEVVPQSEKT